MEGPFIDFQGKWVLVTGASSGIGRAMAVELSRWGAALILVGRDSDRLNETAGLMKPCPYHQLSFDLADYSRIEPVFKELAQRIGRIYGFCHGAGMVETRPLSSSIRKGLQAMMDINLFAGLELARVLCRRDIMEEEGGSILFISSIYARVGMAGQIGYSASKGAVSAAARAMAVELARRKIRVNTLLPGLVKTAMIDGAFSRLSGNQVKILEDSYPLGPGTPEEVARAGVFLLAPQNTWITGSEIIMDGGYTAQ
jgi:NAD(P)-dependent dehydrogenase (short-subunit alcohol dehydrogenase family)